MTVTMSALLRFAVDLGASDIHITAGDRPTVRLHGDIHRIDHPPLTATETHSLIFEIMTDSQRRTFQERLEVDFAFKLDETLRFRVNAFVQNRGEGAVLRHIPAKIPSMEDLGLPATLKYFCTQPKGLVLVTGPTGSGKSTTLAAMVDSINTTSAVHVLTLEDPIEFVHEPKRAIINQREVGSQTHSFQNALRSALREDPDIILVGELRDLDSISLALTAAETGHLVFATLHTSSAPKTVDRIIDVFPANQQPQVRAMLSESLLGVVTQTLLRRKTGGRVAGLEVLVATPAVRNIIREAKTHQLPSIMQVGASSGMQTMESAIVDLVKDGVVTPQAAAERVPDSHVLAAMARTPTLAEAV